MSFNWPVEDITSGLKVIWSIWEAVSDGAVDLPADAGHFLEDFAQTVGNLRNWELRAESEEATHVSESYRRSQVLKEECITFIRRQRRLIQDVNPQTESIKEGHRTWLKEAKFTKEQVASLYDKTQWAFELKEVARLRDKLQLYLQVPLSSSTKFNAGQTLDMARDMRYIIVFFAPLP